VYVLPPAELGQRGAAGKLLPVPEAYTGRDSPYTWKDLLPLYRSLLLVWDAQPRALPILGDTWVCYYRDDLFRDPTHQASFRAKFRRALAAPATWEEYADIADYFDHQPRPGIAQSCSSLPPLAANDDDLDREFYTMATSLVRRAVREDQKKPLAATDTSSFHFDLATSRPHIAEPGFVAALQLLQLLQKYRPPEPQRDPPEAFARGEAVLCLSAPTWVNRFQAADSRVRDRFGICPVPGSNRVYSGPAGAPQTVAEVNRIPYLGAGGWLAVVSKDAPHPDAAFELLAELSGQAISLQIVLNPEWGGGAFRRQHLDNIPGWDAFGLDRRNTEALRDAVRQTVEHPKLINPVERLRVPDQGDYQKALVEKLHAALGESTGAAETLSAVAKRWQELQQRKDPKVWRTEYRLSLGMER
jgi:ABC-type glycerol-3-phosphate transport system substrate-binding protein